MNNVLPSNKNVLLISLTLMAISLGIVAVYLVFSKNTPTNDIPTVASVVSETASSTDSLSPLPEEANAPVELSEDVVTELDELSKGLVEVSFEEDLSDL